MIEHAYRSVIVQQRGRSYYVPQLDESYPSEAAACEAIDKIIEEWLSRPDDEPASADAYECACAEAHTDRRQCHGFDPHD